MVLDKEQIKEIGKLIPRLVNEGNIIRLEKEKIKEIVDFYLDQARISLDSAELLYKVSTDLEIQRSIGLNNFNGYLWAINTAYYSMFYLANAALANQGWKIKSETGVHKITFDCFVYHFFSTNKIAKVYVEEFLAAQQESIELLGKEEILGKADEKAKELINNYDFEREKRKTFTYQLESFQISAKAKTSIDRANNFYKEVRKLLK